MIGIISNESFGFPYSGNPDALAQKRLVIMQTERKFENLYINNESCEHIRNFTDSGFYILRYRILFFSRNY